MLATSERDDLQDRPKVDDPASSAATPLCLFDVAGHVTAAGTTVVTAKLGARRTTAVELRFEVSAEAELAPVDRADAFFPIALLAAMRANRPLHVDAPLSPRLLYHANGYLGAIVHRIHPGSHPVPVTASEVRAPAVLPDRGVCSGFSCGVDSFAVLDDHFLQPTVPGFRLTHLLFNNVGSHRPRDEAGVFQRRLERVRRVAAELGLPLIVTTSNQSELLGYDFMQFQTLRNATVPLLLQEKMARFYYAAAFALENTKIETYDSMAVADPALLPLLATEAIELIPIGGTSSRVEKTQQIATLPIAQQNLDVCVNSPPSVANCGYCPKCVRTLFTLELLGVLDAFASNFDMAAYWQARPALIARMHGNSSTLSGQELRDLAARAGFRTPWSLRLKGMLLDLPFKEKSSPAFRKWMRRMLRV